MNTFRTVHVSAIVAVTVLLATAASPAAGYTPSPVRGRPHGERRRPAALPVATHRDPDRSL